MNELKDLQEWYSAQCNGDWEHGQGVHIETLDNPGWLLKIDLTDTKLMALPFKPVIRSHKIDWLDCHRSENQFVAAGGPRMLGEMILVFLSWTSLAEQ